MSSLRRLSVALGAIFVAALPVGSLVASPAHAAETPPPANSSPMAELKKFYYDTAQGNSPRNARSIRAARDRSGSQSCARRRWRFGSFCVLIHAKYTPKNGDTS